MFKTIFVVTIVLTTLFGAAGVTVATAQNSQPGEPLYPVKAWSEQMQLSRTMLRFNQQAQLQQAESGIALQTRDQIRVQTQDMLNEQLRLQTQGMTGEQIRLREQDRIQQSEMSAPQNQGGGNPWMESTPTPGSGYGPGLGTCLECTCTLQAQNGSGGQGQANPGGQGGKP